MDFDGLTSEQIRIEMSKLGWQSQDRLSWMGWGNGERYGYSIWFQRYEWHGVKHLGNSVTFGDHSPDLGKMVECTRNAAKLALKAWDEFPNKVPCMLADGSLMALQNCLQPDEFKD